MDAVLDIDQRPGLHVQATEHAGGKRRPEIALDIDALVEIRFQQPQVARVKACSSAPSVRKITVNTGSPEPALWWLPSGNTMANGIPLRVCSASTMFCIGNRMRPPRIMASWRSRPPASWPGIALRSTVPIEPARWHRRLRKINLQAVDLECHVLATAGHDRSPCPFAFPSVMRNVINHSPPACCKHLIYLARLKKTPLDSPLVRH